MEEPDLGLVQSELALAELEFLFDRSAEPCGPHQPGLGADLPFGHMAVVKGQLAGLQVTADEQGVTG